MSNCEHSGPVWDIAALEDALNEMHQSGRLFGGRYAIRGAQARRYGSQGVVQLAHGHVDDTDYAIK
jgi:hypothetical protein